MGFFLGTGAGKENEGGVPAVVPPEDEDGGLPAAFPDADKEEGFAVVPFTLEESGLGRSAFSCRFGICGFPVSLNFVDEEEERGWPARVVLLVEVKEE